MLPSECYLPPGTEHIPLFPNLRGSLLKKGVQRPYRHGNRVLVSGHRPTVSLTPSQPKPGEILLIYEFS